MKKQNTEAEPGSGAPLLSLWAPQKDSCCQRVLYSLLILLFLLWFWSSLSLILVLSFFWARLFVFQVLLEKNANLFWVPSFPTKQSRYDHWTNLVDKHSLCAANLAACRALDKGTPSISNRICPVDTRAIQPVGFPFPLPILTSVGFSVRGRSAKTLTQILAFLQNCPLIARWNCPIIALRAASIARDERRPALLLLMPYLPKASSVPSGLQPLLHLPLLDLLNFVRFGARPFF